MEILDIVHIAQYFTIDQMICVADGLPSIVHETHPDEPIHQCGAIECILVQLAIDEAIGADDLTAIIEMMQTKLFAQLLDVLVWLILIDSMFVDASQLQVIGLQYFPDRVCVAEEAQRHKHNLAEVQKCFEERQFDVDTGHALHNQRPDGQWYWL